MLQLNYYCTIISLLCGVSHAFVVPQSPQHARRLLHHKTITQLQSSKSPQDPTFSVSTLLDGIFKNEDEADIILQQEQQQTTQASLFQNFLANKNDNLVSINNLDDDDEERVVVDERVNSLVIPTIAAALGITAMMVSNQQNGMLPVVDLPSLQETVTSAQQFFNDPTSSLEAVVVSVKSMGSTGPLYFGLVYTIAEILAFPALPLTMSAGYLFGVIQGTGIVLLSASIAAAVSFVIGRTILRSYVEELLQDFPRFAKMDRAIGKEGFKVMLLLRLSPIFPFALSNYLYGATSVGFWPYFFGTMLGFTPGTMAYVYSGEVGKALTLGGGDAQPWYIYLGVFAAVGGILKVVADVATGIIEDVEEESS